MPSHTSLITNGSAPSESCIREGGRGKRSRPLRLQRACLEEVSGDVMGLAPLVKLQKLELWGTQVVV
eukprot:5605652-Amphidinium_carterae.1